MRALKNYTCINLLYSSLDLPETGINKKGRNVKEIYLRNSVRFPTLFVKLLTFIANNTNYNGRFL